MQSFNVVLLQGDREMAQSLMTPLTQNFRSIRVSQSLADLRNKVSKERADVLVLDMEMASLSDVENLAHEFPELSIVCTHRLADDQLWTATLNAGAVDCCQSRDVNGIVRAALNKARMAA